LKFRLRLSKPTHCLSVTLPFQDEQRDDRNVRRAACAIAVLEQFEDQPDDFGFLGVNLQALLDLLAAPFGIDGAIADGAHRCLRSGAIDAHPCEELFQPEALGDGGGQAPWHAPGQDRLRKLAIVLHRMGISGTESRFGKEETAAA
jgi:hypothetical protein